MSDFTAKVEKKIQQVAFETYRPKCERCGAYLTDTADALCDACDQYLSDKYPKAYEICRQAIDTMAERGKTYDKDDKQEERSMGKTVAAFNALTGQSLTEEQGWLFMAVLKMARAQQGDYKADNYLDGTSYFALAGEAAAIHRQGS